MRFVKFFKLFVNLIFIALFFTNITNAQKEKKTFPSIKELAPQAKKEPRPSQKAFVGQRIGIDTDIRIDYSRPGIKGRIIWGGLVKDGLQDGTEASKNKPHPWRGGANECTTISFNKDVVVDNKKLPAGKYSLHFIPSKEKEWTVIFNKNTSLWGSFEYNSKDDALRIKVKTVPAPFEEWLKYGFDDLNIKNNSATIFLHWEKIKVPFVVQVIK